MERRDYASWLESDNEASWSLAHLRDAQKQSLIAIGMTALITALLWNGLPTCKTKEVDVWVLVDRDERLYEIQRKKRHVKVPILWPFKTMTVLFHEICHAVIGFVTGGKPIFISVDQYEGGLTEFAPRPHRQPNAWLALPAGYLGSCTLGCVLIFAGFDALWSKYAAVGLEVLFLLSTLICLSILPKWASKYHSHNVRYYLHKWVRCDHHSARESRAAHDGKQKLLDEEHREKVEDELSRMVYTAEEAKRRKAMLQEVKAHERMIACDVILFNNAIIMAIIAIAWYFNDSLGLRFVILGLGTLSAVYAIWDVYYDGVRHGQDGDSDCTAMAHMFHQHDWEKWTKYYAMTWLVIEIVALVGVILAALYHFRTTIAEQALESRQSGFLVSPNHYSPADLLEDAQNAAGSAQDTVNGWLGSSGDH